MFNKKINITFYTDDNGIFVNEKPTFKPNHPEWNNLLKNTYKRFNPETNSFHDGATVKNCPGIHNFMNYGIKFKTWTDLKIRVNPNGLVEELFNGYRFDKPQLVQHDPKQYEYLYPDKKTAFKLNNPWLARCNSDIKFMLMESHYSTNFFIENGLYIAPGIIDYKYQSSLNVHVIVEKKEKPYELFIPYGTPLITLFPITDKKIKINYEHVSREKYSDLLNIFPKCPVGRYYQLIKNLKN